MRWDICCKVIDNWGDAGVCWRLARQLAAQGETVRLWIDDPAPLQWMAPQGAPGVAVRRWAPEALAGIAQAPAPDVLVEAFGCEPAPELIAHFARHAGAASQKPSWINLEYLSAEPAVERLHGLPSPVQHGAGRGRFKHFFYPGFTPATGGLLREPALAQRLACFDRPAWLAQHGIDWQPDELRVALFCYEPPALEALLAQLAAGPGPSRLLVTAGRATQAVHAHLGDAARHGALAIDRLPLLTQDDFDHLLWSCDLNLVRGEDSLVRALWAGAPFVWQIYPQHDDAHHAKLEALLDWLDAPAAARRLHRRWNGLAGPAGGDLLPLAELPGWHAAIDAARARALAQDDLVTQLRRFVSASG